MLRKLVQAGVIVLVSTATAYSQPGANNGNTASGSMPFSMAPGAASRLSPEELQREQEVESKYRETVNKIPDKKGSNDPWGSVRTAPAKTSSAAKQKQP